MPHAEQPQKNGSTAPASPRPSRSDDPAPAGSLLAILDGQPAAKVTREDRLTFEPADGTLPPPEGKVHSFSSQYYRTDLSKIDRFRAYVRHRKGTELSGAAMLRAILRSLDESDPRIIQRVLDQAERDYWADPRRNPRPDDPRHHNKGRAPLPRPVAVKRRKTRRKAK